jgi:RNA polymerase sigma factor (sigma-70 family)
MTNATVRTTWVGTPTVNLMSQEELPPSVFNICGEIDVSLYRLRTVALLRWYGRASVELGRLPSLLGRGFFRTQVVSRRAGTFEDLVIFVADMERALENLSDVEKKLLAMNVLEEYTVDEVARLLGYSRRTVQRLLPEAIDQLSKALLFCGYWEGCQGGKNCKCAVSGSKKGKYKS